MEKCVYGCLPRLISVSLNCSIRARTYRIKSLPSEISFYWEVSTAHIELVTPESAAWAIGGLLHFLHFCVRVAQIRKIPDSDLGWEDMYREDEGESWFDWVCPTTYGIRHLVPTHSHILM